MNLQVQKYVYPDESRPPLFEKAQVQEKAWPWRYGMGWVLRLPFTNLAVVVSRWIDRRPADSDDEGQWLAFRTIEDWEEVIDVPEEGQV